MGLRRIINMQRAGLWECSFHKNIFSMLKEFRLVIVEDELLQFGIHNNECCTSYLTNVT